MNRLTIRTQSKQDKQANSKQKFKQKYVSIFLLTCCVCSTGIPTPSHAGIFDPLFNIFRSGEEKTKEINKDSSQNEDLNDIDVIYPSNTALNSDTPAVPTLPQFAQNPPNEPKLYDLLEAEFAIDRGEVAKGLAIYKRQAFGKNATAVFERALELSLEYEDIHDSLAFANLWYQQYPEHVPAWFYVAHLALQAHEYQLAGETLGQILTYDPKADLSQILDSIYPEDENDQRELLNTLQELYSEENSALSVFQAGLLLKFNEANVALIHIDRALKFEPDNVPYIILKADILKQLKQNDKALEYIKTSRKRIDNSHALYLYEIRQRINLAKQDSSQSHQAWELLLEASKKFPEDAELLLLAALVSLDNQEYKVGDSLLTDLLDRPAYVDQANYYLGISAERQNLYEKAKNYFVKVMQEDLAWLARKKAVAYSLIENDTNDARNILITLRQDFPIYAIDSYLLEAETLQQYGEDEQAKAVLAKATQEFPNNEELNFAYATLLNSDDDYSVKYKQLNELQHAYPDNLTYQLAFATLLSNDHPNNPNSKQIAEDVLNIPPSDVRYDEQLNHKALNILATAELVDGNYQQVIDQLADNYQSRPSLSSGILLLQAYQGLNETSQIDKMTTELEQRFGYRLTP